MDGSKEINGFFLGDDAVHSLVSVKYLKDFVPWSAARVLARMGSETQTPD